MTRNTTTGEIAGVEVSIETEGDEALAEKIHSDLTARAEEIRQMVEDDTHPDATEPPYLVDWEGMFIDTGGDGGE